MNKNSLIILVIVVLVIISSVIYNVLYNNRLDKGQQEEIVIGFIGPFTGDAVSYGEPIHNGIQLAVSEINKKGGIDGRSIRIVPEDGKCTGEGADNATRKLINTDKVQVIIGGVCSDETLAIIPIAESAGVTVLSPSASSSNLTGISSVFFRNVPSDGLGGAYLAERMIDKYGVNTIVTISEETEYAQALLGVLTTRFEDLGGKVLAGENYVSGTSDFKDVITNLKSSGADAIVVIPQTEIAGGRIVKQLRELGVQFPIYTTNILSGAEALSIGGEHLEDVVFFDAPEINTDNQLAVDFLKNYNDSFDKIGLAFYTGAGYDSVYILADAIRKVGYDGLSIVEYLSNLKEHNGVIGDYRFDENGDLLGIDLKLKTIKNGSVEDVK